MRRSPGAGSNPFDWWKVGRRPWVRSSGSRLCGTRVGEGSLALQAPSEVQLGDLPALSGSDGVPLWGPR